MIPIRHIAALAALCSVPILCLAQSENSAASKPAEPMKAEATEAKVAPKPVFRKLTWRSRLDARECLAFPTNHEVIICAEKFM